MDESEREDIRKKIKGEAINLCTQVVNTSIEYKEELLRLEKDNSRIRRENNYFKKIKTNLENQNKTLVKELKEKDKKIEKLIKRIGPNKICFNCTHSLDCGNLALCIYCKNWLCECCVSCCEEIKDGKFCPIFICSFCVRDFDKCPKHTPNTFIDKEELVTFYEKNRFKKY
jgi:hypothetical protein